LRKRRGKTWPVILLAIRFRYRERRKKREKDQFSRWETKGTKEKRGGKKEVYHFFDCIISPRKAKGEEKRRAWRKKKGLLPLI